MPPTHPESDGFVVEPVAGRDENNCNLRLNREERYRRLRQPEFARREPLRLAMAGCSALEEHPDGSEHSVTEDLIWDDESNDVTVALTREYLRPNQAITLRWEVSREHA